MALLAALRREEDLEQQREKCEGDGDARLGRAVRFPRGRRGRG